MKQKYPLLITLAVLAIVGGLFANQKNSLVSRINPQLTTSKAGFNDIVINARGTNGKEKIALFINNAPVQFWSLTNSFADYTYTPNGEITVSEISIHFLNDRWEPENSINYDVQIPYITVNGTTYNSEHSSTVSTGSWDQDNWCAPGNKQTQWLNCNGSFTYNIPVGTVVGLPTTNPICGNNQIEEGETCDDGNVASGDGCSASCQEEVEEPALEGLPNEISSLNANLIFEDDFDDQPDWVVGQNDRCKAPTEAVCSSIPNNWDMYYSGERWHPDEFGSDYHASGEISSDQFRGASGKSYIQYDESYGGPSQWGSEAQLVKELPTAHKDIYVEFWFKFQPGYRIEATESSTNKVSAAKMSRVFSYQGDPDGHRFQFFQDGNHNTPLAMAQYKVTKFASSGLEYTTLTATTLCSPASENMNCSSSTVSPETTGGQLNGQPTRFLDSIGDGEWHKWAYRAKYNSADGVADGLMQQWIDDELVMETTGITFTQSQVTNIPQGFNTVSIGGNMNNIPVDPTEQYEQWLAYDDIKVYSLD